MPRVPPGSMGPLLLLLTAALAWHVLAVVGPEKPQPREGSVGRDFATYYYAVQVGLAGGNPYDTAQLTEAADAQGWRTTAVHPLLYPPPALLAVAWSPALALPDAALAFRVLGEVAMLVGLLALVWWWRPLGSIRVLGLLAVALALMSGVAYGVQLGQANAHVWGLTCLGVALAADDRPARQAVGGGLVACAVLGKLAPLAFVGLWVLERRWVAVASAGITAVVGWSLSLLIVGGAGQVAFFTDVLPSLSSGAYNGLSIRIGMFGNHSVPALLDHLAPGRGGVLAAPVRAASTAFTLVLGITIVALFRAPPVDPLARAARFGAVGVALLLVPVYTFEHHLIWAVPAFVVAAAAAFAGRLPTWAAVLVGVGFAVLCTPIVPLRRLHGWVSGFGAAPALVFEEMKLAALLCLFGVTAWLGRTR